MPITKGESALLSVRVEAGSRLTELTVADSLGRIDGLTAVAVLREEELLTPRGGTRFLAGDRLLAVATPATQIELNALIRAPSTIDAQARGSKKDSHDS